MNDSIGKKDVKTIIQTAYSKDEIINLLQKILNDYNMIDSKMKEILKFGSINIENYGKVFKECNDCQKYFNHMLKNKKYKN